MNNNGTDRDVAISIVSALGALAENVTQINDNLFVPHIITQPVDATAAVGGTATFSVVANNVKAYQWQYQNNPGAQWRNSTADDATTDTRAVEVAAETYYQNRFRCQITGLDGSIIYTDIVKIIEPEPEPEPEG